ncbi:dephospho-CoA kinase [Planctomycetales bacterium]|nr:dephospho-CoA kinase [Planctomycetales bacterium]
MKILAVIGGIGSGKSTVSAMFEEFGVPVIDADKIGHRILELPQIIGAARCRWGEDIFTSDGKIERTKVADIVFKNSSELMFLNNLTHPVIAAEIELQKKQREKEGAAFCLIDAPLIIESGSVSFADVIIFVHTPFEQRLQWVEKRGWTKDELDNREAAQLPIEQKRATAHFVIDNTGSIEDLREQVKKLLKRLRE